MASPSSPKENKNPLLSKLLALPQGCEGRLRRAKSGFSWILRVTQLVSQDAKGIRKEENQGEKYLSS